MLSSILRVANGLMNLLQSVLSFCRDARLRQEGRREAQQEATQRENEDLRKAAVIDYRARTRNKRVILKRL